MNLVFIFLTAAAASLIQGVTGFGAAIVMISIFPYFMSLSRAAALNNIIAFGLILYLLLNYRKQAAWKNIPLPAIFYFIGSAAALAVVKEMDTRSLKMAFGLFLMLLAVFFIFFNQKVHLHRSLVTLILCGLLAGVCDGAFGAGSGPIFVLYFLSVCSSREEYIGTVQGCLMTAVVYLIILKTASGLITTDMLVPGIAGLAGAAAGLVLAKKTGGMINDRWMRNMTYGLIAVSGITTFLGTL